MSNEIELYKGDNKTYRLTVLDGDGEFVDISLALITFTVRKYLGASNISFTRKNLAAGGSATQINFVTDGVDGKADIFLIPENTSGLDPGMYVYDVQVVISTKVYTVISDSIDLKEDVTK